MDASECLSEQTLEGYAAGTISNLDAATIDAHLNDCRKCLARLDQLASQPEPLINALRRAPGLAHLRPRLTR
jgi:predicted anti-sigma-YlaC factor YlaD